MSKARKAVLLALTWATFFAAAMPYAAAVGLLTACYRLERKAGMRQ